MKADRRQNCLAESLTKSFSLNFLSWIDYYVVMPTVVHNTLILCFASTAMTVPVLNFDCIKEHKSCTVNYNETRKLLVHCTRYHTGVNARQDLKLNFWPNCLALTVCLEPTGICSSYSLH